MDRPCLLFPAKVDVHALLLVVSVPEWQALPKSKITMKYESYLLACDDLCFDLSMGKP